MATYNLEPEAIITDLLRELLTDPRSTRENTTSETFLAGSSEYTLIPPSGKVIAITSLTIGGVAQTKWKDYFWDWDNKKIKFSGNTTGEVIVNYKHGTNWIYPDKPAEKINDTGFPRISVIPNAGVGTRLGQYEAPMEEVNALMIDIWVKEDFIFTDGNSFKFEGEKLAAYIARESMNKLTRNEDKLHAYGYNLRIPTKPRALPFDAEYQAHHKLFIIEFNSTMEGEVTI